LPRAVDTQSDQPIIPQVTRREEKRAREEEREEPGSESNPGASVYEERKSAIDSSSIIAAKPDHGRIARCPAIH
jgi:hypothetical protein